MSECPVCLVYDRIAVAAALLEDLAPEAIRAGQVPAGLGGTIPLARQRLLEADEVIHRLQGSIGWELTYLGACVGQTIDALGVTLTPPGVSMVAAMARDCRRQAHEFAWAFWRAGS